MSEIDETKAQASTPAKTPKKRAAKTAKKAAPDAIAAASHSANQVEDFSLNDEALDDEIRRMDYELKVMQLRQSKQAVQKFDFDESEKTRKAAAAQRALRAEERSRQNVANQCAHQLGGFGLEDTYSGDDKPSIVVMDLPIEGMRMALCVRCPKEWRSPDPRLKKSNPEVYVEQAMEWRECLKLIKASRGKAMGGPTFRFETESGTPIHPHLV